TAKDALRVLRSLPDAETLVATLKQLLSEDGLNGFNLAAPGPVQTQILSTLVNDLLPTFWPALHGADRDLLLKCFCNVSGLNALLAKLRAIFRAEVDKLERLAELQSLLGAFQALMRGDNVILNLWTCLQLATLDQTKRDLLWKELAVTVTSGKIISTVAQAEDVTNYSQSNTLSPKCWLSNGAEYARWLGRNIAQLAVHEPHHYDSSVSRAMQDAAQMLAKSLNLGYSSSLIGGLISTLIAHDCEKLRSIFTLLPAHAKRRFLEQTLRWLSTVATSSSYTAVSETTSLHTDIEAIAFFLSALLTDEQSISFLTAVLYNPTLAAAYSRPVIRASIAALAHTPTSSSLETILECTMSTFNDRLFIEHAPILQQEVIAQVMLMTAGYLHRRSPMSVLLISRSSQHMQGTSNRLDTSGNRARWLGMIVATSISSLVDKEGSRMDFATNDVRTEEAVWYLGLVRVQDGIGSLQDFSRLIHNITAGKRLPPQPVFGPPRPPPPPVQSEVIGEKVTEIVDADDEDEQNNDGLKPYAKPDSDPEDSDDDATLVNRNKPRPPVYIRDLMTMLRDDKDHDRFQLGIKHAAPLVRRKSNFGSEVKDHAEELLSLLCNLQDPFDTDNFDDLRLRAMIAVLLSDVEALGPWLSKQVFVEGYSIAQRGVMMTAIGLAGRELAGLRHEDEMNPAFADINFPSKTLQPRLHATYTTAQTSMKRLQHATNRLEDRLMQPLALKAADHSTTHLDAVKVRTFSSRLTNESQRTVRKRTPNKLSKLLATAFFQPLISRYNQDLAFYASSTVFATAPIVLTTFLKTIALLLHASGPATLHLPDLTAAFWDLLLTLRVKAAGDITVLEAVLFSLLTMLEVNAEQSRQRLGREEQKRLAETQAWAEIVFEKSGGAEMRLNGGGNGKEEEKVRRLAAGVLVKCGKLIEEWRKEMFG
ncbi:hypothetical protein BAUCODRAFT_40554, partial [Baudoinia panamericana UAMH 10762]